MTPEARKKLGLSGWALSHTMSSPSGLWRVFLHANNGCMIGIEAGSTGEGELAALRAFIEAFEGEKK